MSNSKKFKSGLNPNPKLMHFQHVEEILISIYFITTYSTGIASVSIDQLNVSIDKLNVNGMNSNEYGNIKVFGCNMSKK